MIRSIALASLVVAMLYTTAVAQGAGGSGQIIFNTYCRQCHSMREGDNRLGPSLHGIFGEEAGQVQGYANYSGSLQQNVTWDEATLDQFITDAESIAPNTNMIYPGVADATKRKKIIDFLKSNGAQ